MELNSKDSGYGDGEGYGDGDSYGGGEGYGAGYGVGGGEGYGYGDGVGDGYGVGYGDGGGYGDGVGYGVGDGYGDGVGYGVGYGAGVGYGVGYGAGIGYCVGDGYGDGYGFFIPETAAWTTYHYIQKYENDFILRGGKKIKTGQKIHEDRIMMCEEGLHASLTPKDAAKYKPKNSVLTEVKTWGHVVVGKDKLVSTDRMIIREIAPMGQKEGV